MVVPMSLMQTGYYREGGDVEFFIVESEIQPCDGTEREGTMRTREIVDYYNDV